MSDDYQSAQSDNAGAAVGSQGSIVERNEPPHVLATEVKRHYQSKLELYGCLTNEVGYYLPPHRCATMYWIKDLWSGKKKGELDG